MNNQLHQGMVAQVPLHSNNQAAPPYCPTDMYYHQTDNHHPSIRTVPQLQQHHHQHQQLNHHHQQQQITLGSGLATFPRQQNNQTMGHYNTISPRDHQNHHQQQHNVNALATTNGFIQPLGYSNSPADVTASELKQSIYEQHPDQTIETLYDYQNHNYLHHSNGTTTITYQIQQEPQHQEPLATYDSQQVANGGYSQMISAQPQQHIQYITAPGEQVDNMSTGMYVSNMPTTRQIPHSSYHHHHHHHQQQQQHHLHHHQHHQPQQSHYNHQNHAPLVPVSNQQRQQQQHQINVIQQQNGSFIHYNNPQLILQNEPEPDETYVGASMGDQQTQLYYSNTTNLTSNTTNPQANMNLHQSQQATTSRLMTVDGSMSNMDQSILSTAQSTGSAGLQEAPSLGLRSFANDDASTIVTNCRHHHQQLYASNNQLISTTTPTTINGGVGGLDLGNNCGVSGATVTITATGGAASGAAALPAAASIAATVSQHQQTVETINSTSAGAVPTIIKTPIAKNGCIITNSRSNVDSSNLKGTGATYNGSNDIAHQRSISDSPYVDNQLASTGRQATQLHQQHNHGQQQTQQQQDFLEMRTCGNLTQDRMDYICDKLIGDMDHFGICVIDNFLGSIKGELILKEVQQLYSSGQYTKGRLVNNRYNKMVSGGNGVVGSTTLDGADPSQPSGSSPPKGPLSATNTSNASPTSTTTPPVSSSSPPASLPTTTSVATSSNSSTTSSSSGGAGVRPQLDATGAIRSDRVIWVDGCEDGCSEINNLIQTLCSVITNSSRLSLCSNNRLDRIVINKRTKAHVACYPGNGTRYIKHIDNPNGDGRVITAIYYLNKDWKTERDGGLLRMFPTGMDSVANIEPLFDRALFFWSDRRNPHEVLPAYRDRKSHWKLSTSVGSDILPYLNDQLIAIAFTECLDFYSLQMYSIDEFLSNTLRIHDKDELSQSYVTEWSEAAGSGTTSR